MYSDHLPLNVRVLNIIILDYTSELDLENEANPEEKLILIRKGKKYSPNIFSVFHTNFKRLYYKNHNTRDDNNYLLDYINYIKTDNNTQIPSFQNYLKINKIPNIPIIIFKPTK